MNIFEIILSSIGLASDAVAVSISKGLSFEKFKLKNCFIVGIWFGLFQSLMFIFGYVFGSYLGSFIFKIDHYISFLLLVYIGFKMVYGAYKDNSIINDSLSFVEMFMFAIATSLDAFSFGLAYSFGYGNKNTFICFSLIGLVTFILSFIGTFIGSRVGYKFEKISKIIGGLILIGIGFNVLFDYFL